MAMKRSENNSGTVTKLSGNRRNPYIAKLPYVETWDGEKMVIKREILGYFKTESAARRALAEYRLEHPEVFGKDTKKLKVFSKSCTMLDLWNNFTASSSWRNISLSTQGNYTAVWNKWLVPLHELPVTSIKTSYLSTLINNIEAKSGTKKNALVVVRKLLDIAIADDIISKNYANYVEYDVDETEIARECFTNSEIEMFWDHREEWICQLLLIELYSGARITEIINLKTEDIHLDAEIPYFHIREGKNKFAVRDVPIHFAILSLFKDLMSKSSDYLLKCEYGQITDNMVQNKQGRIKEICGKDHYVYDAKHTFITQCAICGVDRLAKITIIGHTPKGTSEKVYTHLQLDSLLTELNLVKFSVKFEQNPYA